VENPFNSRACRDMTSRREIGIYKRKDRSAYDIHIYSRFSELIMLQGTMETTAGIVYLRIEPNFICSAETIK
jgi:hypothetical protein